MVDEMKFNDDDEWSDDLPFLGLSSTHDDR